MLDYIRQEFSAFKDHPDLIVDVEKLSIECEGVFTITLKDEEIGMFRVHFFRDEEEWATERLMVEDGGWIIALDGYQTQIPAKSLEDALVIINGLSRWVGSLRL